MSTPSDKPTYEKHFTSSILLWMRTDQPRQQGMDHWSGPHSGIIAATPGLVEYRQIHLEEDNPGHWPASAGLETAIPPDRRVDGIAEVTFSSPLSPLMGRAQTQLAYADEVNVFRRTLLHAGPPGSSRWYDAAPGETGARSVVFFRRADGVGGRDFRKLLRREVIPALLASGSITELRSQMFLPWNRHTWDTPDVAHDNPEEHHLHGALVLGFPDDSHRARFDEETAAGLTPTLAGTVSAVHSYHAAKTLTFVDDGEMLDVPLT